MPNRKLRRLTRNHRGGEWNPDHHNATVRQRKIAKQLMRIYNIPRTFSRHLIPGINYVLEESPRICGDEVHSWDVADPDTADAYWAHCTLDAGHDTDDHYDHNNHLRWSTERNFL